MKRWNAVAIMKAEQQDLTGVDENLLTMRGSQNLQEDYLSMKAEIFAGLSSESSGG